MGCKCLIRPSQTTYVDQPLRTIRRIKLCRYALPTILEGEKRASPKGQSSEGRLSASTIVGERLQWSPLRQPDLTVDKLTRQVRPDSGFPWHTIFVLSVLFPRLTGTNTTTHVMQLFQSFTMGCHIYKAWQCGNDGCHRTAGLSTRMPDL